MLTRAALATLIGLCLVGGASAQSLCDGPLHWGYCHPPESQSPAQQTQSDQRGTDTNPLVIKEISTEESKAKAQHEAESEAGKASRERQLIWATWAIALVTGLLMGGTAFLARYTYLLWMETRGLAVETKSSADKQLKAINDNAERQLRAYPGITGAHAILSLGDHKLRIAVTVENRTVTPAYKFRHTFAHRVCEPKAAKDALEPQKKEMQWDMTPGAKSTLRDEAQSTEGEINAIWGGQKVVIFGGRMDYEDAFGKCRHIEFSYRCAVFAMHHTEDMKTHLGYVCAEPEPTSFHST